jgi:hypothetical protein
MDVAPDAAIPFPRELPFDFTLNLLFCDLWNVKDNTVVRGGSKNILKSKISILSGGKVIIKKHIPACMDGNDVLLQSFSHSGCSISLFGLAFARCPLVFWHILQLHSV